MGAPDQLRGKLGQREGRTHALSAPQSSRLLSAKVVPPCPYARLPPGIVDQLRQILLGSPLARSWSRCRSRRLSDTWAASPSPAGSRLALRFPGYMKMGDRVSRFSPPGPVTHLATAKSIGTRLTGEPRRHQKGEVGGRGTTDWGGGAFT